jgi:AcrR family transcriptional regulator
MTPFIRQLNEGAPPPAPLARSRRNASRRARERQRLRILSAMTQIVCEQGVQCATVARVVDAARVSRLTFYDLFADRDDCLRAVLEETVLLAGERAHAACAGETRWVDRVRAALLALLEFFDEEPDLARLCVVHALAAGSETLARRVEVLGQLAGFVDQGRGASRSVAEPALLTAEGVVGGTLGVIHARLVRTEAEPLVDLLNPLMGLIVLPYLGAAAALREGSAPSRLGRTENAERGTGSSGGSEHRLT